MAMKYVNSKVTQVEKYNPIKLTHGNQQHPYAIR